MTWCVLLGILFYGLGLLAPALDAPVLGFFMLGVLVLLPFQAIYIYRLADALRVGAPVVWVLGVILCSCLGLILLLYLSSRATTVLREAGFKVGLMGASIPDIEAAISSGQPIR